MNPLRKYGITDAVLNDIAFVAKHNPDQTSMANSDRPEIPVSVDMCKAGKKPKKIWNSFIKMNMHNFIYVNTKPGFYSFVCKAYNGQIFNVDIEKVSHLSYIRAVEKALTGLADQILELKVIELAKRQKQQEELREKLGGVDLNLPEGMELNDELVESISGILDDIKEGRVQLKEDSAAIEGSEITTTDPSQELVIP